jgi:hypothetical protein
MENLKMLETFNKLEESIGKEATKEIVTLLDLKLNEMNNDLATKADLAKEISGLRADMHKMESTLIKWIIGIVASGTIVNQLLNHFM